mmetsp:Transcript_73874/g.175845  ORF Transcript_73874/g.175845 Transcript_73874/m.175845 type:complete len:169 (+) Transcript_73874:89-595(+)
MSRRPGTTVHERVGNRFEVDQRAALWGGRAGQTGRSREADRKAAMSREVIEGQNDSMIEDLESKVGVLKDITLKLGKEAKESNSFLETFGLDFDKASALMKDTLGKLKVIVSKSGNSHMCYMMLFIVFIFFLMYALRKLGGGGSSRTLEVVKATTLAPLLNDTADAET